MLRRKTNSVPFPIALLALLAVLSAVPASGKPLLWSLEQNQPNPFCPDSTATQIRFSLDQSCRVTLNVLTPDSTEIFRTLVDGAMAVGLHVVIWNGKDGQGQVGAAGDYPYRLTARTEGGELLFEETLTARIDCPPVPADRPTWGSLKRSYR